MKAEGQEIEPNLLEAARGQRGRRVQYRGLRAVARLRSGVRKNFGTNEGSSLTSPSIRIWPILQVGLQRPLHDRRVLFMATNRRHRTRCRASTRSISNQRPERPTYENYVAPLYEDAPWLIGDDWFQYVDEPATDAPVTARTTISVWSTSTAIRTRIWCRACSSCTTPSPTRNSTPDRSRLVGHLRLGGDLHRLHADLDQRTADHGHLVAPGGTVGTSYFFGGVYAAGGIRTTRTPSPRGTFPGPEAGPSSPASSPARRRWPVPPRSPSRPRIQPDPPRSHRRSP